MAAVDCWSPAVIAKHGVSLFRHCLNTLSAVGRISQMRKRTALSGRPGRRFAESTDTKHICMDMMLSDRDSMASSISALTNMGRLSPLGTDASKRH